MTANYFLLLGAAGLLSARHIPHRKPRLHPGYYADIEGAPWQVSVQVNGVHYCGGSIYSWFLRKSKISSYKPTESNATGISTNDIGFMKLRKKLETSNQVKAIPLASKIPAPGSECSVTGWGYKRPRHNRIDQSNSLVFPEILQSAVVHFEGPYFCKRWMSSKKSDIICAGMKLNGMDSRSCIGDDGGPLVFKKTLVGVSIGRDPHCNGPPFCTSVVYHHNWLISAIKEA